MRPAWVRAVETVLAVLHPSLPAGFTGRVILAINFHRGTAASAALTVEEGAKLGDPVPS